MLFKRISRHLLYAGLKKEEYDALREDIELQNWGQLTIYSSVTMLVLCVLSVTAWRGTGFGGRNQKIYIAATILCLLIAISARLLQKRLPGSLHVLSVGFELLLYGIGFAVSLTHRELPAVTEIAFLLIVPHVFYDPPLYSGLKTLLVASAFCLLSARIKAPEIAWADIYNTAVFAVAAFIVDLLVTELQMACLYQEKRIVYLSETDVMTGLKNRNSYEAMLTKLPELCKKTVLCVYGDVNGLHEINNTQGHAAGDHMLIATANVMKKHLGAEHLYRIGGDEFVSVQLDNDLDVESAIENIQREISRDNYHMSFGVCRQVRDNLDVPALIRTAEEHMYREKTDYYEQMGIPIRNE